MNVIAQLANEQLFIIFAPVKQKEDNKIQQIFSATLKLVMKYGIAGITMRHIAKEAHMATGTLYIYFKDKDQLIIQLYQQCKAKSIDAYFQGYDPGKPFAEGFRKIWENILHYRLQHFEEGVFMEQSHHSPFISETAKEQNGHLFKPLYKLIDRGKEEKIIKDQDSLLIILYIMGTINNLIKYSKYFNKKWTPEVLDTAFSFCWDGVKR